MLHRIDAKEGRICQVVGIQQGGCMQTTTSDDKRIGNGSSSSSTRRAFVHLPMHRMGAHTRCTANTLRCTRTALTGEEKRKRKEWCTTGARAGIRGGGSKASKRKLKFNFPPSGTVHGWRKTENRVVCRHLSHLCSLHFERAPCTELTCDF